MTLFGLTIRDRDMPVWAGLASAAALGIALASQYWGGLAPCKLCLWQRVPHGAVIVIALGALLWFRGPRERAFLGWLAALAFAVGGGIAVYHAGVEQGWFPGPTSCTGSSALDAAKTIDDLRRQLLAEPVVRCDEIPWSLFGLSIAAWNALFCIAMAAVTGLAARRAMGEKEA
jgi:disulfide bond formation protein DsbB